MSLFSRIGGRLGAGFIAVLSVFALSLAVTLSTLNRIADAEREVARLDRAKHAGHYVAAMLREQYIHEAHVIITGDLAHLDRYAHAMAATRAEIAHLRASAEGSEQSGHVAAIAHGAEAIDAEFRAALLPALLRNDRAAIRTSHAHTERIVDNAVRLTDKVNHHFEERSAHALAHAEGLRVQARAIVVVCFALAIVAAAAIALWLTRSIVRPLGHLSDGATAIARGELATEVDAGQIDEFAALARAFNGMATDIASREEALVRSQRLAAVGQLAAGVAHEINNPLGVILGYAQLLARESSATESTRADLRIIEDEARQCQRIVEALLDLARPVKLVVTEVDLAEIARNVLSRFAESNPLGAVRAVGPPDGATLVVAGDEAKLRQVVVNLVQNAIDVSPPDGTVAVDVALCGADAVVSVTDAGPGMADADRARAFEPFFTTKAKGTGLGLAISQAIADAHGGRIILGAAPTGGTCARLILPRETRGATGDGHAS
jgi:signal transduction histidine kinase